MKVEIQINRCRFCKFFVCETPDGMDFLDDDETKCNYGLKENSLVHDDDSCSKFQLSKDVLKELKLDYGKKFVKVLK